MKLTEGYIVKCDDGKEREVIHRKTAIEKGQRFYFTGRKCRLGHIDRRKVNGYHCVQCIRVKQKARHKMKMQTDPEYRERFLKKRNARHHRRYQSDPEYKQKFIDRAREYRERHRYDGIPYEKPYKKGG